MNIPGSIEHILARLQAHLVAGDLAGYQAEILALACAGRLDAQIVPLRATTLTATVLTATVTYTVPERQGFLVDEVRGLCHMTLPDSETTTFTANVIGNSVNAPATFEDRMLVKAYNVRIDNLRTNEGGSVKELLDTSQGVITVGDLHPKFGMPVKWKAPKILKPRVAVTLSLAVESSDTSVVGAATNYGVAFVGLAITE